MSMRSCHIKYTGGREAAILPGLEPGDRAFESRPPDQLRIIFNSLSIS